MGSYPPAGARTQVERVRGTQSLVHILGQCWSRPGLLLREVAWRWLFGVPALAVLAVLASRLARLLAAAHVSFANISPLDPVGTASTFSRIVAVIGPQLRSVLWVLALLAAGWAAASGVGRGFLLRTLAPVSRARPLSLAMLHFVRVLSLVASVLVWALLVRWAAAGTVVHLPPGAEPNTVSFAAWLICLSLGCFSLWAVWSWVLSIAAVLMVSEGCGVIAALQRGLGLGALIPKLIEVNLVLGIVKLALIVLALVFASIPLPFEAVMSGAALYVWWALVAVWYLAASDFFQVVRLAGFLQLYQRASGPGQTVQQLH